MDTNVPAIEPEEDVTVNIEGDHMAYPEAPENSDIALFKQQIAQTNAAFGSGTAASKLESEQEQTEGLIDLSHRFKTLLGNEIPGTDEQSLVSHKGSPLHGMSHLTKTSTQVNKTDISTDQLAAGKEKTGVQVSKTNVPADGLTVGKEEHSDTEIDSFKRKSVPEQDNTYVAPSGTPLLSHLTAVQGTATLESHAAMISQQIKDQVIDRILVSTNDIAADKIVKVVINPNVLEGTEVNFQKVGNMLSVQFASKNEASLQFLQANQIDLQGFLQGELKQFKGISVSVKPSGNNLEQPEDGRSRNRYEYQTPDEDEQ